MLLVVTSIAPMAFASNDTDEYEIEVESDTDVRYERRERMKDGELEVRERVRERIEDTRNSVREVRVETRERIRDNRQEARTEIRERVRENREDYREARETYVAARTEYRDSREKIVNARVRLRTCEGEECAQVRADIKAQAQPFLLDSADLVIEALERLAARIQESDLSEEEKTERIAEIDARIEAMLEARVTVENLDGEATQEEIREASREIREAWAHSKVVLKKQTGFVVNHKIRHVYDQLEKLGERLDNAITKLTDRGADVSVASELMVEFEAHLDAARAEYEAAQELYAQANEPGEVDELVRKANEHVRAAHTELLAAREILRDIVQEVKAANSGNLSVDDSEDASDEADDDSDENLDDDSNTTDDSSNNETNNTTTNTTVDTSINTTINTTVEDTTIDANVTAEVNV